MPHSAQRKNIPITSGVLDYFPAAIAEVAYVSYVGNEKHNPGTSLHHARGKSMDHADCIARHLVERGTIDVVKLPDGREFQVRHTAYVAWRALALLQEELEAAGAPLARGARLPEPEPLKGLPLVEAMLGVLGALPIYEVREELRQPHDFALFADR
jgi:hypothetical protein